MLKVLLSFFLHLRAGVMSINNLISTFTNPKNQFYFILTWTNLEGEPVRQPFSNYFEKTFRNRQILEYFLLQ